MAEANPRQTTIEAYNLLLDVAGEPAPRLVLWDGTSHGPDSDAAIVLSHPAALRAMLLPPSDLVAAEAYVFGDVDLTGNIYTSLDFGRRLDAARRRPVKTLRLLNKLRQLPEAEGHADRRPTRSGKLHSKDRDQDAVRWHYDTGNEFFRSFLDDNLVYSCAYFLDPEESLERAQRRKLDVVCRKAQLSAGQRLLDVGCGWGSLVIHAATRYDVEAVGITLSEEQAAEARVRVKDAGVDDRVSIEVRDYREIDGVFDSIVSIGMVEHVGEKELGRYFKELAEHLTPRGVLVNHGITTRDRSSKRGGKPTFVDTYVFPDGELEPIEIVLRQAEEAGFHVRDVESLRPSYALTLRHWVDNLESNRLDHPVGTEEVFRIWRTYMAGSAIAFEHGGIDVFQMVAVRPQRPWSFGRSHMIAGDDV
jgi:cyclopropane-fatty-acyl-phospholipid synthase